jgi:hypothetical protein
MPVTVRVPGWATSPTTSQANVVKVGAVKQGRNAISSSVSERGRLHAGIGGGSLAREGPPMLSCCHPTGKPAPTPPSGRYLT